MTSLYIIGIVVYGIICLLHFLELDTIRWWDGTLLGPDDWFIVFFWPVYWAKKLIETI